MPSTSIFAIFIFLQCSSFQQLEASSLAATYIRKHQILEKESIIEKTALLPRIVRSESTDNILSFELRNSRKSENEMFNLAEKLYLKNVSEIIENYGRNKAINSGRYYRSAKEIEKGGKMIPFSYSHFPSYELKIIDGVYINRIEEQPLKECDAYEGRCRVRVVITSTASNRTQLIREAIKAAKGKLSRVPNFRNIFSRINLNKVLIKPLGNCRYIISLIYEFRPLSYFLRWISLDAYRQDDSIPNPLVRQTVCGESGTSRPNLVPAKEELNAAVFLQDTVLKLQQYMTEKNLGDFESNVNMTSIRVDPFRTPEQFRKTVFGLDPFWYIRTSGTKESGHSLQESIHGQEEIPSRDVCRKKGKICGIVASIQANQAVKDQLIHNWIKGMKKVAGFKKAFNPKKKQISVKPKNVGTTTMMNSKYKYIVILFLPYKSKQLKPATKK